MISKVAFVLIVFLLCSCAPTSVSSTSDKKKDHPLSEMLPMISGISIQGPCYFYTDLLNLLKSRGYSVFNQIINSSNGNVILTFRKLDTFPKYIVGIRTPKLICVIASGKGALGA